MRDYIKFAILNVKLPDYKNLNLDFTTHVNLETGIICNCKIAYSNGLFISVINSNTTHSTDQIIIEGNPRSYWYHMYETTYIPKVINLELLINDLTEKLSIDSKSYEIVYLDLKINSQFNLNNN